MDVTVALGKVLRRVRIERGLTQEELALRAGLDRKYVSLLELATYQTKITTVFRLAEVLGYQASELVAMTELEITSVGRGAKGARGSRKHPKKPDSAGD